MASAPSDVIDGARLRAHGRRAGRPAFRPEAYEAELRGILEALRGVPETLPLDVQVLDPILRRYPRDGSGFFSRSQLIAGMRHLAERDDGAERRAAASSLARRLQLRPVRSLSGVTPVTVLTKPFPCPGRCVFCPNDVRMPKSYLSAEPGAQRAADNGFDPYLQTWNRLAALHAIGHPTDKIELIVLGGTWSFYPHSYQLGFVTRCLEALNDFGRARSQGGEPVRRSAGSVRGAFSDLPAQLDGRNLGRSYNGRVAGALRARHAGALVGTEEGAGWERLERAQRANESGSARCVGLSLETRPDHVDAAEVERLRRLGCTKVQLGIQSLSDAVLEASRRGHDTAATRRAVGGLRRAGFKIHAHWMPNLVGATPADDVRDFARLFDDPALCPDELKIYPCSLIESAELMGLHERGAWRPYAHDELLSVLVPCLERVPRWCRVTRVVRDISSDDIVEGNKLTNFRELAERELARRGGHASEIRAREVRGQRVAAERLQLRETAYPTATGRELFLELTTRGDALAAFLRLSLPSRVGTAAAELCEALAAELEGAALLRELHVYGAALGLGERSARDAQHRGLGRRLVEVARQRARAAGYAQLSVISAVGTRDYYRRLGFADGARYQHLRLD